MTESEDVTTQKDGEHTEINLQPLDDDCRLLGSVRCVVWRRVWNSHMNRSRALLPPHHPKAYATVPCLRNQLP